MLIWMHYNWKNNKVKIYHLNVVNGKFKHRKIKFFCKIYYNMQINLIIKPNSKTDHFKKSELLY